MAFAEIKGKKIFFAEEGADNKDSIVLIHGAGCNHKVWRAQLSGLSGHFRVLAVDLPGHGLSDGPPMSSISGYTQFARDFTGQVVKNKRFYLGGHSMGGAITLNYALDFPADLDGIILVATGSRLRVNKAVLETYQKGRHYEQLINYAVSKSATKEIRDAVQEIKKESPPSVCFNDYTACDNFDVSDRLAGITTPTLVTCGKDDMLTPPKYSDFLVQAIQGSLLKKIEGSGHFICIEKPDFLNANIIDFLSALKEV